MKAPNGATAADQGNSLHGSGGLQFEAPGGAAAIAKEDMLRDTVVGSTLSSRSGRVKKQYTSGHVTMLRYVDHVVEDERWRLRVEGLGCRRLRYLRRAILECIPPER